MEFLGKFEGMGGGIEDDRRIEEEIAWVEGSGLSKMTLSKQALPGRRSKVQPRPTLKAEVAWTISANSS